MPPFSRICNLGRREYQHLQCGKKNVLPNLQGGEIMAFAMRNTNGILASKRRDKSRLYKDGWFEKHGCLQQMFAPVETSIYRVSEHNNKFIECRFIASRGKSTICGCRGTKIQQRWTIRICNPKREITIALDGNEESWERDEMIINCVESSISTKSIASQ